MCESGSGFFVTMRLILVTEGTSVPMVFVDFHLPTIVGKRDESVKQLEESRPKQRC